MSQNTVSRKPRKTKKLRFSLLHSWLVNNFEACKVADVGGGKGMLAMLLQESGWDVTVIDPEITPLPNKYKTIDGRKLNPQEMNSIKTIQSNFENEMAKDYDLIIGMHVHGANMQIIKACADYGKDFLLFPCCVIGEPIEKEQGINWRLSLLEYAKEMGHDIKNVHLNFAGRNIGHYTDKNLKRIKNPDPEVDKMVLVEDSEWN